MRRKRSFDREFKLEALRLIETSGKTMNQIERDLGLASGQLTRWKQAFAKEGEQAFPGHGHQTPEKERIRQLEAENEILRQERDILHLPWLAVPWKKAVAIFAHLKR